MKPAILRCCIIAATLPLLGGCVAAIVPIAAGGALLGKSDKKEDVAAPATVLPEKPAPLVVVGPAEVIDPPSASATVSVASVPQPETQIEEFDPGKSTAPAAELPPVSDWDSNFQQAPAAAELDEAGPDEAEAEGFAKALADGTPAGGSDVVQSTQANAPLRPAPRAVTPADFRAYDVFYAYVDQQARRDPVDSERQSALLASPGSLSPRRTDCSIRPPAVVLDLDPAGSMFDPAMAMRADPALTQILLSLRLQDIEIFWASERSALDAGAVRKALVESGLDPQARDGLLLMRRENDRKQIRRKELGETHCLIAIAGDDRADFDELYLYLKDRAAAQSLEALIGAGWFLAPLPLTEGK